jgi:hypothetical protein
LSAQGSLWPGSLCYHFHKKPCYIPLSNSFVPPHPVPLWSRHSCTEHHTWDSQSGCLWCELQEIRGTQSMLGGCGSGAGSPGLRTEFLRALQAWEAARFSLLLHPRWNQVWARCRARAVTQQLQY